MWCFHQYLILYAFLCRAKEKGEKSLGGEEEMKELRKRRNFVNSLEDVLLACTYILPASFSIFKPN